MTDTTTTTEPCSTGETYNGVCQPTGGQGDGPPLIHDQLASVGVPAERVPCTEDMPCWDCSTMGNLICGPTVVSVSVVAPPLVTELPATGGEDAVLMLIASAAIALGVAARRIARRL